MPSSPRMPDRNQIRDWWSQSAVNASAEPGVFSLAGSTPIGWMYRQQAEWGRFRALTDLNRSMRVLELGCGAGRWALRIASHVHWVTGIDISPEMIRIAKERQADRRLGNVDFAVAAAEDFRSEARYDLIYLSSVDQYLEDEACFKMIGNLRAMLAPGGTLIDRVTIRAGARAYANEDNGYWAVYRTFSELDQAFASAGLVFRERRPSHNPFLRVPWKVASRPWCLAAIQSLLKRFPRLSCAALELCSAGMDAWRPENRAAVPTSHDFLRYDFPSPGGG